MSYLNVNGTNLHRLLDLGLAEYTEFSEEADYTVWYKDGVIYGYEKCNRNGNEDVVTFGDWEEGLIQAYDNLLDPSFKDIGTVPTWVRFFMNRAKTIPIVGELFGT